MASSLVGTKTRPWIWSFVTSTLSIIGIEYEAVLPVPFLALAIIFLFYKAIGMLSSWIGDGFSYPFS